MECVEWIVMNAIWQMQFDECNGWTQCNDCIKMNTMLWMLCNVMNAMYWIQSNECNVMNGL